ncbi:MAG: GDP-mannose 4,6-dehydratase [Candidatus Omnitrophica bacterium]|nr:GDP-mannose 4,6-dehydratase [Candidatus Omnitrophota bacterium]
MPSPQKTALVTGGAGFIGSHLVDELVRRRYRVRVLDNLCNGKRENLRIDAAEARVEFIKGDVTRPADLDRAMEGARTVFHLACLGVRHSLAHPEENHHVNALGTLRTLEAARRHKVRRFVYCSSSEVYGTARTTPMKEEHPTHPCTVYGAGKLAGESYARAFFLSYGLPAVIIRPFNTYGPRSHHEGDAGEMIPKSIVRTLAGEDIVIFGDGSQTRDFTYVTDSARGLAMAAADERLVGKTFNLGTGRSYTILQIARMVRDAALKPRHPILLTPGRPGDVLALEADAARFKRATGWRPRVGFADGLRQTVDFFAGHPLGIRELAGQQKARNW